MTEREGAGVSEELVYRISTMEEWELMQKTGSTFGGDLDRTTGFIHLSKLDQVQSTLLNFFLNVKDDLYLLQIDAKKIEARKPKVFDNLFLSLFRNKMVQETGWDSEKPGYQGLIEVAHRLTVSQDNSKTRDASVRILKSLFPPLLLELYRMLIAPIHSGKFAALMVARVTALSCQWLMGPCTVNSVHLPNGSSLMSGVFVEKCKYLEESKCVGVCINTCKLPTQTFFKDHMGVPLLMEPNFIDYSCQFKFGILPPQQEVDDALKEPCLEICPSSVRRNEMNHNMDAHKCPKA